MEHHPYAYDDYRGRVSRIAKDLRIQVIHVDESICVIVKPANLRSVPGHAKPPLTNDHHNHENSKLQKILLPNTSTIISSATVANESSLSSSGADNGTLLSKKPQSNTLQLSPRNKSSNRNPQNCWVMAIKSFEQHNDHFVEWQSTTTTKPTAHADAKRTLDFDKNDDDASWFQRLVVKESLSRLAKSKTVDFTPRKWKSFVRLMHRIHKQIMPMPILRESLMRKQKNTTTTNTTTTNPTTLLIPKSSDSQIFTVESSNNNNNHHNAESMTGSCGMNREDDDDDENAASSSSETTTMMIMIENISQQMFQCIHDRYRPLLKLPEPSPHEDSALGQLILMGYGSEAAGNYHNVVMKHHSQDGSSSLSSSIDVAMSTSKPPSEHSSSSSSPKLLYAVHRLDCETSGVMVFARTERAASYLSHAWRLGEEESNYNRNCIDNDDNCGDKKREDVVGDGGPSDNHSRSTINKGVTKVYLALVKEWPPFHHDKQVQGCIDLPLAPSQTERIKWQVQLDGTGKPSRTLWRVLRTPDRKNIESIATAATTAIATDDRTPNYRIGNVNGSDRSSGNLVQDHNDNDDDGDNDDDDHNVLLELTPLTGRTHQLRIHCAHVGSGIVGDSKYGSHPVTWTEHGNNQLRLHAYRLCVPHPDTETQIQFIAPLPPWAT